MRGWDVGMRTRLVENFSRDSYLLFLHYQKLPIHTIKLSILLSAFFQIIKLNQGLYYYESESVSHSVKSVGKKKKTKNHPCGPQPSQDNTSWPRYSPELRPPELEWGPANCRPLRCCHQTLRYTVDLLIFCRFSSLLRETKITGKYVWIKVAKNAKNFNLLQCPVHKTFLLICSIESYSTHIHQIYGIISDSASLKGPNIFLSPSLFSLS